MIIKNSRSNLHQSIDQNGSRIILARTWSIRSLKVTHKSQQLCISTNAVFIFDIMLFIFVYVYNHPIYLCEWFSTVTIWHVMYSDQISTLIFLKYANYPWKMRLSSKIVSNRFSFIPTNYASNLINTISGLMSFFITLIIHLILSSDSSSASISSVIGWKK